MNKQLLQRALALIDNLPMDVYLRTNGREISQELRAAIAAPEVEPVSWRFHDGRMWCYLDHIADLPREKFMPLYTTPPDTEALRKELERVKGERDAMAQHMARVKHCLMFANEQVNGPICDTIWYSESETLFDYIDAAIAKGGE